MRLFRFPKRDPKMLEGETPLLRFLRYVVILLLFGGVIWGLWMNNQKRIKLLKKNNEAVVGQTLAPVYRLSDILAHCQNLYSV